MKLNKKQIEFLDKFTRGKWTINEKTGLVDIEGDFRCDNENLTDFKGVKFGVVTGSFDCDNNSLTSLEGAPHEVGGSFDCEYNKLTSLVGAPQKVRGDFYCDNNSLTSLEGAPQEVGESFDCSHNSLTSLEGAPQKVGGSFDCENNSLTSLEGAPLEVGGSFYCRHNSLTIPKPILDLVVETMYEKGVNYYVALSLNRGAIEKEINKRKKHLEKIERVFVEIDANLSKDAQKGYSVLDRFGLFD